MIALVTGASRGIGLGIARHLVEAGHYVLGTATSQEGADSISRELGSYGRGESLDISSLESISEFLDRIKNAEVAPLLLVNNAGFNQDNLSLRMKSDEWSRVIEGNLSGTFFLTQGLIKGMVRARYGRVVNLSSVVARMGNAGQANYAAAKAGLEGMTRSLAAELAARNITVNAVAPGFIETDMTEALSDAQREEMLRRIPSNRLGSVDDVAALVGFLCSDQAGYITGETLKVNGGMYLS